ncbi:MAG: InlB B-repeat-containing protein [Candidatus Coprovivens sp.]
MISKKMNREFKIKNIMLASLLVLFVFTCVICFVSYANESEIEKVLKSEDYDYLSNNAKDFIRENYELSGNILLTEKNKEENRPYLNPLYVNYLNMEEEEKEDLSYIPAVTVVDFVPTNDVQDVELQQYDLRDYNIVTPNRNQGRLGLCWAFATASTLETSIMKKNNTTYNADTTQLISERQLDYATSVDGIKDYDNEYVKYVQRKVGSGGNFYISTIALANGVSVADYGWAAYDDTDKEPKELEKVLSYSNSLYEVTGTLNMPIFVDSYYSSDILEEARLEHINLIKQSIERFGSAVVATYYSDACMHYENGNANPLLNVNSACYSDKDGHAMTVIGWDDDYEYNYCADTKQHIDSIDGCTNVVSGRGAWILKNSWGAADANPYLAYTSQMSQFHLITSIKSAAEKEWDNNYVIGTNAFTLESTNVFGAQYRPVKEEKLKYVKFMTADLNGEYNFQLKLADGTLTEVFKVTINSPGLVTLDFSSKNFSVNGNSEITISGGEFIDTISIFTEDIATTQEFDVSLLDGEKLDGLETRFYSETKNIPSGQEIEYLFYDKDGNSVTDKVTVTNNRIAENNINALVKFDASLGGATYEVRPTINGEIINIFHVDVPEVYALPGSGTADDPYLIASESDLNQIRYNLDAHYKLTSSIQLSEEWEPIGTLEEPFRGSIDGDGYNIKNLVINADTDDPVAFIAYYLPKYHYDIQTPISESYTEDSYIRNMLFENAEVTNTRDAAVLIGKLIYDNSGAPETAFNVDQAILNIENIRFYDPVVTSSSGNAGSLAASIKVVASSFDKPYLRINNTYDSSHIKGYLSSGYIGYIEDINISGSGIMLGIELSNFQFTSVLEPYDEVYADNLMHSPVIGGVYGNVGVELSNYIINSIFTDVDYFGNFVHYKSNYAIGYYDNATSNNVSVGKNNGYYVTKFNHESNANTYVSASEIKDMNLYSSWTDFETYWIISTSDGIQRLPLLKTVDSSYTDLDDINLELYDSVSLLDYIYGANDFQYVELVERETGGLVADIQYNMIDPNKDSGYYDDISIDALGVGTVKVRIINNYDGFDKEININVTAPEVERPTITYYKSGLGSESYTQEVVANEAFTLNSNTFSIKGYSFECWSTTPDNRTGSECYEDASQFESGIKSNLNLYAQWVGDTYKLKYDANGGTGEMPDKTFTYVGGQSALSIGENLFTREGYSFNGWNTQADGKGISFPNRGSISHTMWTNADLTEITLYAQWRVKDYSITYNANGGSGSMEPTEGTEGSTVMIKYNIFIKVGKEFNGWNTEADGSGTRYTEGQNITLNSDMTLYAQWIDTFTYSIKDYSDDKTNKYIDLIGLKTSVSDYKKKFTLATGVTIEVDIGTKSYVYTGSKTKIYRNGILLTEYTNIVRGDINGDGNVSAMDYVKIKNHIMGTNKITDPLLMKATDANQDNKISSMDYVRIKNIIMGGAK